MGMAEHESEGYPMTIGVSTGSDTHPSGSSDSSSSSSVRKGAFNDKPVDDDSKVVDTTDVQEIPLESSDDFILPKDEKIHHAASKLDILTHSIHVVDDPSLPALTFRTWFIGTKAYSLLIIRRLPLTRQTGLGLAGFGGTISAIYYFKPQTVSVSIVFLAVISFLLGEAMSKFIPRRGRIGRFLNPHPFNMKEHLAIVIMANAASTSALGIELLAVQRLYYRETLNGAISIFLLFSSQFLGYGLAGMMRKILVYPRNMLWPANLPVNSMLENLHARKADNKKPMRVFLIVFACIFCWGERSP